MNAAAVHDDVRDVAGWLEPGDIDKLYELGREAPGPFLEIGTFRGKSTTVLTRALRDAGRHVEFVSLDIDLEALRSAHETLAERGLDHLVTLVRGSVHALFVARPTFQPRFVFLDGDHSAKGLGRDLAALERRVPEGGVLLFHDFTDGRNALPQNKDYGVPAAIESSWVASDCEFVGTFGCTGLYRRARGPVAPPGDDAAVLDLVREDRVRIRLLVSVLRPWKRRLLRRPS